MRVNAEIDELYRELNLTWSATLPADNQLVVGEWWLADPANSPARISATQQIKKVSVEKSLAEKLHLAVGDTLTFTIGDQQVDVSIASVRALAWDRMRPNFYFIFEPGVLEDFSATYITSFYLPAEHKSFLNQLLKQFPTLSVFSVDEMIRRIQLMVTQVSQAIELVLVLILVAGILVLIAILQASLDQRLRESALLRSFGASRRLILGSLAIEFLVLGALAGLVAALGSAVAVYGLQRYVFDLQAVFYAWPWLAGPATGMMVIGGTGLLACIKVVRVPPLRLLQEQAS